MDSNIAQGLRADQSVGAWVTADYRLAALFDRYSIDFCCGGDKLVGEACAERGVSFEALQQEAQQVRSAPGMEERYDQWAPEFLADYIVNQFHTFTKQVMPQIAGYVARVANVHGAAHPETIALAQIWPQVQGELSMHMQREELQLFPYIKRLVHSVESGMAPKPSTFGSAGELIADLEADHEATGSILAEMTRLSSGYRVPVDACTTYQTLYSLLGQFDVTTRKHVHLENNILFPSVILLEQHLSQRG